MIAPFLQIGENDGYSLQLRKQRQTDALKFIRRRLPAQAKKCIQSRIQKGYSANEKASMCMPKLAKKQLKYIRRAAPI